eukprot:CAMPEP_0184345338 /NCGR_PEP_ID=MMETSP1089-20130417/13772_1 /TAXON_ID=38269 ORGANISM="Gloeochaete wittrockiana, Strain SAG46.84" /NCGR_SAMPLE_ID=MMETSP1089 /ASSEMBLY_ACC=CAM_ASM_000445 /LENGTH=912 /DNA_ID=CAMNT_0026675613 /DNA_START=14 /DNA_END=2752 /DNA_ORIENTATION=+
MADSSSDSDAKSLIGAEHNLGKLGLSRISTRQEQQQALLWAMLASYLPEDTRSIEKFFVHHVEYTLAQSRQNLTPIWEFQALALSVRDRLVERWKETQSYFREKDCKRVAYLSLEFLIGRSLQNAIINLGLQDSFSQAMNNLGRNLESIYDQERDAGLGNGGLGRLAACFMDSLATLDMPAWGYGLRYTYGMFHQEIRDGEQVECPDYWLQHGNPWEVERLDVTYPVRFFGTVTEKKINGKNKLVWEGGEEVLAVAYDTPIPGYKTFNTLNIRLWSAKPSREFDLHTFNSGNFYESIEEKQKAETITYVLYPNDNTDKGKELRVKQQYFFVSATLQDLVRRFKIRYNFKQHADKFSDLIAIQLNDTHPALSIPELQRILMDEEGLDWDHAWSIVTAVFAYTNHTVLPEALEKWPVSLIESLLPRHVQIIYQINLRFLQKVEERWPGDVERLRSMSIIQESPYRAVRMANLAIIGSHTVNGVAELHSDLLRSTVFPYFVEFYGEKKFQNKTNGVTPRRWIQQANPDLSLLISAVLRSEKWLLDLSMLRHLSAFNKDENFLFQWGQVKRQCKQRLADYIEKTQGIKLNVDALFDVQVKRIHEYKRQLLNILGIIYRYRTLRYMSASDKKNVVPRVVFFGGKAAPGYYMAKLIIKFINAVADQINHDPMIGDLLKVVYIADYRVSLAEIIIPASDISQHISTAGMEASGTSNMKFSMNGGLILGTLDGANIEILEEVHPENMFIFGALTADVPTIREDLKKGKIPVDARFNQVIGMIETGLFGQPDQWQPLVQSVTPANDYYLVSYDFPGYIETQAKIDETFKDQNLWMRMSVNNTAGSGKFSSDRTINEYAKDIWGVKPIRRPGPMHIPAHSLSTSGFIPRDLVSSNESISLEGLTPNLVSPFSSSSSSPSSSI